MKNKEKYAKEIIEIAGYGCNVAVERIGRRPVACDCFINCDECLLSGPTLDHNCEITRREWFDAEYKEPIVISKQDLASLNCLNDEIKYITKDMCSERGNLIGYVERPKKSRDSYIWTCSKEPYYNLSMMKLVLPMVCINDEEPWRIDDLKRLKVVDEY